MDKEKWECPAGHCECEFMNFNVCKITGMKYSYLQYEMSCPCETEKNERLSSVPIRGDK